MCVTTEAYLESKKKRKDGIIKCSKNKGTGHIVLLILNS